MGRLHGGPFHKLRRALAMRQIELAALLDISGRYLAALELGDALVNRELERKLQRVDIRTGMLEPLGVEPEAIMREQKTWYNSSTAATLNRAQQHLQERLEYHRRDQSKASKEKAANEPQK